jgi:predicted RNA-binding Zn-ribbon protein involved in translation (DUF1610 family)
MKRPWTVKKVNCTSIILEIPYNVEKIFKDRRGYERLAEDLEELLKDHYMWKDFGATVYEEMYDTCSICGKEYEPDFYEGHEQCSNCGATEIDYMKRKLEVSK